MSTTPKTQITELSSTAANQAPVVNSGWAIVDQLLDRTVQDKDLGAPPGSPGDGDAYIVAASPTGAWAGQAGKIAYWRTSAGVWQFIAPRTGWTLRVADELDANNIPKEYGYTGAGWALPAGSGGSFSGGTLTSALNEAPSVTLASAATVSIGAAAANTVKITGATTITAFDTLADGGVRRVEFQGALTLTHHATALILPTAANITTVAGDVAQFRSLGSGNWKCVAYLRANGQALASSGGGGGLTNLTEAKTTATPNATVPVVSLAVTITETNGDFALVPKGNGALVAAIPNNATSGGNKRGQFAVDLQLSRSAAANVASGNYATLLGGQWNTATGMYSVVGGGQSNTVAGDYSTVGGGLNNSTAQGRDAICGGEGNSTNGGYSFIGGGLTNATSGTGSSVLGGVTNTAIGDYSSICGGFYGATRGVHGAEARASGRFGLQGDAQRERFILRRSTTDATATVISTSGGAPSATNQVVLPGSSAYAFSGKLVARSDATGNSSAWEIKGVIKRGANAAATAVVGTPSVALIAQDSGASAWVVAISADTTNGALAITVTGVAATTIRWVADIETVEVVG